MAVGRSTPMRPGSVFHRPDGLGGCPRCGWFGIPNVVDRDECPACSVDHPALIREATMRLVPKVARNAPCPCGSGVKFKKCCGA